MPDRQVEKTDREKAVDALVHVCGKSRIEAFNHVENLDNETVSKVIEAVGQPGCEHTIYELCKMNCDPHEQYGEQDGAPYLTTKAEADMAAEVTEESRWSHTRTPHHTRATDERIDE